MNILKISAFFICIISLVGCLKNNTGVETTHELLTRENYYISNQSKLDLNVTYQIASTEIDSTVALPADSTTKIFENGGIGNSSTPSSSFASLRFYDKSAGTSSPVLTIKPIINDNWQLIPGDNNNSAKYELVITDADIK